MLPPIARIDEVIRVAPSYQVELATTRGIICEIAEYDQLAIDSLDIDPI